MTDQNAETTVPAPSELEVLKARAVTLGISHHPMIGVDKLREKINSQISETLPEPEVVAVKVNPKEETELERINRLRRESNKLVRVVVTCRNPQKSEWEGEIFTAGNNVIGSVKKYVPFNNTEGWHVPQIILDMMYDRKCQLFVNGKNSKGHDIKVAKHIPEFSIEVLRSLTVNELDDLAKRQAMSHSIDK